MEGICEYTGCCLSLADDAVMMTVTLPPGVVDPQSSRGPNWSRRAVPAKEGDEAKGNSHPRSSRRVDERYDSSKLGVRIDKQGV